MKKIITLIGIAGTLCLSPGCKKKNVEPAEALAKQTVTDTATLYVLIDSKPCATPQTQYGSATIDIRGIKVFNTEAGWEELVPVPGAWDVVSLQTAQVPVAEITENTRVHAGAITKIALSIGDNNKLVVNDQAADCYKIASKEIVIDLQGEIKAGALNEIVLSLDICGNFSVQTRYNESPCYTLKPVFGFQSLVQR
jgi:hypothetical protein